MPTLKAQIATLETAGLISDPQSLLPTLLKENDPPDFEKYPYSLIIRETVQAARRDDFVILPYEASLAGMYDNVSAMHAALLKMLAKHARPGTAPGRLKPKPPAGRFRFSFAGLDYDVAAFAPSAYDDPMATARRPDELLEALARIVAETADGKTLVLGTPENQGYAGLGMQFIVGIVPENAVRKLDEITGWNFEALAPPQVRVANAGTAAQKGGDQGFSFVKRDGQLVVEWTNSSGLMKGIWGGGMVAGTLAALNVFGGPEIVSGVFGEGVGELIAKGWGRIISGVIFGVLAYLSIAGLFNRNRKLTLSAQQLVLQKGRIPSLVDYKKQTIAADILRFYEKEIRKRRRSGSTYSTNYCYHVFAVTADGTELKITDNLGASAKAEFLAKLLNQALKEMKEE